MAKYTGTPIGYFLEIPMGDFYAFVAIMNEEVERENKAMRGGK